MTVTAGRPFLVALDQRLEGYRRFLAAWVCRVGGRTVVIDPGPASTIPHLVERLHAAGIERVDFVLLTHIHLDHGGGSAGLLDAFPEARLWCHERGRGHLLDPVHLWQGSRATIGEVAEVYGEPRPLAERRLAGDDELAAAGIEVIPTPGHAPHHASFRIGRFLFAGEAVATRLHLPGPAEYLRPATPPRFRPRVFLDSLARLERLQPRPDYLCFAHYGLSREPPGWYRRARRQLELWLELVGREVRAGNEFRPRHLVGLLEHEDPDFPLARLPGDIRRRELFYVENSLLGMWRALLSGLRSCGA